MSTPEPTLRLENIAPVVVDDRRSVAERRGRGMLKRRTSSTIEIVPRRTFLRGVGAVAMGAGLAALTVFPKGRFAQAACTTTLQTKMYSSCPSGSSNYGCSPACGPSIVYSDACSGTWHKTTGNFRMRPNACRSGGYDGWWWAKSYCQQCAGPTTFKCHDGCKKIGGAWKNSICRYVYC